MKTLSLLVVLALGAVTTLVAQTDLKFEKKVHDFGEIKQHEPVKCEFKFTNTGNTPVTITKVKPSCGCTTPDYPKKPVLPGETATIKAEYNAAAAGAFNKSIDVTTDKGGQPLKLKIKGTVKPGPVIHENGEPKKELKLDQR